MENLSLGFRVNEPNRKKLETIAQQTGLSYSDIMRSLLETAEVKPVLFMRPVGNIDGLNKLGTRK